MPGQPNPTGQLAPTQTDLKVAMNNEARKYCVTALWEGERQVRFATLTHTQAEYWVRWLKRNEPECSPQIHLVREDKLIMPQNELTPEINNIATETALCLLACTEEINEHLVIEFGDDSTTDVDAPRSVVIAYNGTRRDVNRLIGYLNFMLDV